MVPTPVGDDSRSRHITLERKGHVEITFFEEIIKCMRIDVVTDEPY
jgi:hypothetical protein